LLTSTSVIYDKFKTNCLQIPVFSGATEALVVPYNHENDDDEPDFHGKDGLNDVLDTKPDTSRIQGESAVDGIRRIVTSNPSEIIIF
jgi:inosine-uridine nucleoside N-ribohydrolase